jgi:hypothetical protein
VRAEDRDDRLIGKVNLDPTIGARVTALQAQGRYVEAQALALAAPGRFSVNSDDGNLKYDKGDLISNALGLTTELSLDWRGWGAFVRATGFYDFETMDRDDISDVAKDQIGNRTRLLDAFIFRDFEFGDAVTGNFRLGKQVVSWGESTFIQGGINAINPVDVSRSAGGRRGAERSVSAHQLGVGIVQSDRQSGHRSAVHVRVEAD